MMRLPWKREKRQQREVRATGGPFTDSIVGALLAEAAGGTIKDAGATAALEAAAGQYARAFAVAAVTPANSTTRALTPSVLALMARDLLRRGEFVHIIQVDRDGVRLQPAGSPPGDVRGGPDPLTWRYRADIFGPSGNVTRHVPAAAVVHGRYSIDPARPWYGIGPLGWASLTGRLHGALEGSLSDEAAGPTGHVIPIPASPDDTDPDEDEADTDPLAALRADVAKLRGCTLLTETTSAGWGEGQSAAPHADWRPQRIGADPPDSLPLLRTDSAAAILGACGCPAELVTGADATAARESWRRFLHGSVMPLADLLAVELRAKLAEPALTLTFDRLMASDVQGRARAFQSMTKGGMEADRAATLAGLGSR